MKKPLIALGAILLGFSMNISPANADDKKDIQALNTKLETAFKKKDANAINKLSTPDFTQKMSNGMTMTLAQVNQQLKLQFSMMKTVKKNVMKLSNISVKGKRATGISNYVFVGEIVDQQGQMGPPGKVHTLSVTGVSHMVMEKTPKGWLYKSMVTDKESTMMDGKLLSMPGGPPPSKK